MVHCIIKTEDKRHMIISIDAVKAFENLSTFILETLNKIDR